jgi:ATP-dependent exoDNAse (exonuclease V) beta subunit
VGNRGRPAYLREPCIWRAENICFRLNAAAKPTQAANCPRFGKDSVIRPDDSPGPGVDNVCPGLFPFGANGTSYSVVWWDPRALSLGRAPQFSLRQEQLLHRGDAKVVEGDLARYHTWRQERDATVQRGSEPSFDTAAATEIAKDSSETTDHVEVIHWVKAGPRASGTRFGTLVHATLSVIPMGATSAEVKSATELQARILAATNEERVSAAEIVEHVLLSDLWQRAQIAARKQKCRRETPITLVRGDQIIEGVVDLAFEENDRWIVVDFKTDRELENALARYRNQIFIYARAISEATGRETAAYILRI